MNYGESVQTSNIESEVIETYSDSSQNVETVHRADELGNVYTDNSDTYISSQADPMTDQYDSYINDYSFDHTMSMVDGQPQADITQYTSDSIEDNKDKGVSEMNDFQQNDSSNNYESQTAEELLMSEREREKKSKKELEEEEREKMQYVSHKKKIKCSLHT